MRIEPFFSLRRRIFILSAGKAFLLSSLIGRLFYLQKYQNNFYQELSDRNRKVFLPILPVRGKILDKSGVVLAGVQDTYQIFLNVTTKTEAIRLIKEVEKILSIDLSKIAFSKRNRSLLLCDNVNWEDYSKIELHRNILPGVFLEKSTTRIYHYSYQVSHAVGYIGHSLKKKDKIDLRVGKMGVEKSFDQQLFGTLGTKCIEVDARRQEKRVLSFKESHPGQDLLLNLDIRLQEKIIEVFQPIERGCCLVMHPKTGDILTYLSKPSFDLNAFIDPLKSATLKTILNEKQRPLFDKNSQGTYPPGSLFKMIVGLAGLEANVIDENTTFMCHGSMTEGGHIFHCWRWRHGGHGRVSLKNALIVSCDIFFYRLALLLGAEAIARMASLFGLGSKTGIELSCEHKGLLPTKEWKRKYKKQKWTLGDTLNLSIGQGFLLATPLQITRMMAILINGYRPIIPSLCAGKSAHSVFQELPIDQNHRSLILKAMEGVVNDSFGTARGARLALPFKMGGKTGSSQVSGITIKERRLDIVNNRATHLKDHALFSGYAPVEDPRILVTVLIENGGGGGRVAAPLARDIIQYALTHI